MCSNLKMKHQFLVNRSLLWIRILIITTLSIPSTAFGPPQRRIQCRSKSFTDKLLHTNVDNRVGSSITLIHASKSASIQKSEPAPVRVFQNTFSPSALETFHHLAIEHNARTNDGSSIFTRPPHNTSPLTPIEHAIDSALSAMEDHDRNGDGVGPTPSPRKVEYWSREEYMNIDAHADIDESMLEDEGTLRCPSMGHVLYLQVKDGLNAPTCVFPGELVGWGLNDGGHDSDGDGDVHSNHSGEDSKELVIVPAVEGRILRFEGSAMHAVPNPCDRWLLSRQDEKELREKEDNCDEDDEDFYDDEDDYYDDEEEEEEIERSVLLFNTWADDEPGPRGVNGDIATGALPEGIELSQEDADAYLKSEEARILKEWEEDYGVNGEKIRCNPFSEWNEVEVNYMNSASNSDIALPPDEASTSEVNVSLMGMKQRRLYPSKIVSLRGNQELIKTALEEDSKVSIVQLTLAAERLEQQ